MLAHKTGLRHGQQYVWTLVLPDFLVRLVLSLKFCLLKLVSEQAMIFRIPKNSGYQNFNSVFDYAELAKLLVAYKTIFVKLSNCHEKLQVDTKLYYKITYS